jgi:WD40 repeat protein
VTLWSPDAPEPLRLEWTGSSLVLAWSPTGHHLATGDQDATVHFWMVERRSDLQMSGYPTKVRELAWDSSGRHLATGGGSDVTTWDCAPPGPAGSRPVITEGDDSLVSVLAPQGRGALIAAGSAAGRLFVFRAGQAAVRGAIELDDGVSALAWFGDDAGLTAGTDTGAVMRIDMT